MNHLQNHTEIQSLSHDHFPTLTILTDKEWEEVIKETQPHQSKGDMYHVR